MTSSIVSGLGSAVPTGVLDNAELSRRVDTSDEWIVRRTGIKERHIAQAGDFTSTLAAEAGRAALEDALVDPSEIDLVIVATATPDRLIPPTACVVQQLIGATNAGAFDVNAACAGFLSGALAASGMISSGVAKNVLVIGAEVLSRFVDPLDRTTCILFGDGAGAALLTAGNAPGFMAFDAGADGSGANALAMDAGGSAEPASDDSIHGGRHFIRMNGPEVYRAAVRAMTESSVKVMKRAGVEPKDVDVLICHQANQRIIDETAQRLGIPDERVFSNVASYGNTSAASIPIALREARDQHMILDGSLVLLTTVGAGFTWASALLRWNASGGLA